jgi:G:T/U-mismatch repair DNA glycosylase
MADYPLRCHTCASICPLPKGMVCHVVDCTNPLLGPEMRAKNEKLRKKRYDAAYHLKHGKQRNARARAWQAAHPEQTAATKRKFPRTKASRIRALVQRKRRYRLSAEFRQQKAQYWVAYKQRKLAAGFVRIAIGNRHLWALPGGEENHG